MDKKFYDDFSCSSFQTNTSIYKLYLINDDVNKFEDVIDALAEVCGFDYEKAEQCALITHFAGKYCILQSNKEYLESIQKKLAEKNIQTKIFGL